MDLLIAVIDDDGSFRNALCASLGSLGYDARGLASAEDYLAWEAQASCDCVITDIHMPGMSGLDLTSLLRARPRAVPVILVTARSGPDVDIRAAAAGAICLLQKPFETAALIGCLDKALKV